MLNTTLTNIKIPDKTLIQPSTSNNQITFKASTYEIKTAMDNGANTCTHVKVHVKKPLANMEEIQNETDETIKIPLVGQDINKRIVWGNGLSKTTIEKILSIAERLGKAFNNCSETCSKKGLTMGEVIANVFSFWGIQSNFNVGNPFTIETTKETQLTKDELIESIEKSEDPYKFIRDTLKLQPLLSSSEKQARINNALKEIGVKADELNSRTMKA